MSKARDLANASTAFNAVSATELGYVDGVTSAIQTQLNAKQAVVSGVDNTEIGYLDGVTSAIQTQLDAKIPKTLTTTTGDIIYASSANTPARLGIGSSSQVLTVSGGVPTWATPAAGGKVLQIVNATTTTKTSTNGAFTDATNCSATITPSATTSKILILVSASIRIYRNADYQTWGEARIRRSTTTVSPANYYFFIETIKGGTGNNVGYTGTQFFNILDAPSTTSATTYQLQIQGNTNTSEGMYIEANYAGSTSITLMEIGA